MRGPVGGHLWWTGVTPSGRGMPASTLKISSPSGDYRQTGRWHGSSTQVFHIKEFLYLWRALKDELRVVPSMFRHHLEEPALLPALLSAVQEPSDGHWNFLKFPEENRRMERIANGLEEDYEVRARKYLKRQSIGRGGGSGG